MLSLIGETVEKDGPIEENTPYEKIRKEPYPLPKEFEWSTLDLNNESEVFIFNVYCLCI